MPKIHRFAIHSRALFLGLVLSQALLATSAHAQGQPPTKAGPVANDAKKAGEGTANAMPLFYKKLEVLDSKKHKSLAISRETNFSFAAEANVIPLVASELSLASKHYPLVFVAEANAPAPTLVAMVGLGDNKNAFVDPKGNWRVGAYVPAWARRYPFLSVKTPDKREAIVFDPGAKTFLGKNNLPLFQNDQPTDTLRRIVTFQNEYNAAFEQTTAMVTALKDSGVLEAATLTIGNATDKAKPARNITGFLVVNEAKLRALDSAALSKLHQANALGLAYAQLLSMSNLQTFSAAK